MSSRSIDRHSLIGSSDLVHRRFAATAAALPSTCTRTDMPPATLANWRQHPQSIWGFCHVDELVPTANIAAGPSLPLPAGPVLDLNQVMLDHGDRPMTAAEVLAATHTDGFLVLHDGAVIAENYGAQRPADRHINFSVSKSITGTLAGVLAADGRLDTDAPVIRFVPEAAGGAYGDCTVRHLLDMTVAIRFTEDYLDPLGDVARYRVAMGWNPPGVVLSGEGIHGFIAGLPKGEGRHGERFHYVSPNSDMLGWVLERAGGAPVATLLSDLIWKPMGAEVDAFITVDRSGGARTAGGICTTLRDLARFGELIRGDGQVNGKQVIPRRWIDDIFTNGDRQAWQRGDMTNLFPHGRYRSKWYAPDDKAGVLCAIGIHGQWIWIDRTAGMVAVKQSSQPLPVDDAMDHQVVALFRALARELTS
jgi:CubicO group peptidase (beta-lactamase class C family)